MRRRSIQISEHTTNARVTAVWEATAVCGIAGFLTPPKFGRDELESQAQSMALALSHRGPDDAGTWVDPDVAVAFGHRRLAVLDLSHEGHQPLMSRDGQWVLNYNGEIYNHVELRRRLEGAGVRFRGTSDTEVLTEAIARWGVEAAVRQTVGMFAFAAWDRSRRALWLGRDRLGEKPLYYGRHGDTVLFGSELKSLRRHPRFGGVVNRNAVPLFLRHLCVPAPHTIYEDTFKLPAGHLLEVRPGAALGKPFPYWSLREAVERGLSDPFRGDAEAATAELERLLRQSIRRQMVADVPVGAFFSGGIDSSVIVALMQAQTRRRVKTFSIGFPDAGWNELPWAGRIAERLETDHTDLVVAPADALAVIPQLPQVYDEPFADSSQIPTFLVSRLARRDVTVALSGDGADELFGGYDRYRFQGRAWDAMNWIPKPLKSAAASSLTSIKPSQWDQLFNQLGRLGGRAGATARPGDRVHKAAQLLHAQSPEDAYARMTSYWLDPASSVVGSQEPLTLLRDPARWPHLADFTDQLQYVDTLTYLPDDILTKVDRATMAVSLEARVPFLDHEVVEFAWRLPPAYKYRDGQGKWILRQVLSRYLPPQLHERPKMGFGVPIGHWLRGPLREWAESLLATERISTEGFLAPDAVRHRWTEHQTGGRNLDHQLWAVLMFQAWLDSTRSSTTSGAH